MIIITKLVMKYLYRLCLSWEEFPGMSPKNCCSRFVSQALCLLWKPRIIACKRDSTDQNKLLYQYCHNLARPLTWGHQIYNYGRPSLAHHYYKFSVSNLCPRVKKESFKQEDQRSLTVIWVSETLHWLLTENICISTGPLWNKQKSTMAEESSLIQYSNQCAVYWSTSLELYVF